MKSFRAVWTSLAFGALALLAAPAASAEEGPGRWYYLHGAGHKGLGFRSMYIFVPDPGWKNGQTTPIVLPKQTVRRPCPIPLQPKPAQHSQPSYWAPSPFGEQSWVYVPNYKDPNYRTPPDRPTSLPPKPPTGKGSYCEKEDPSKTESGASAPKPPAKPKKKKKKKKKK